MPTNRASVLRSSPDRAICSAHEDTRARPLSCGSPPLCSTSHCRLDLRPHTRRSGQAGRSPLVVFLAPRRSRHGGATKNRRAHHPRVPASSGFLNLLTPCSPPCPARLFHRAGTLGILPSETCSSLQVGSPLDQPAPACRSTSRRLRPKPRIGRRHRSSGFQAFTPESSPAPASPPPVKAGGCRPRLSWDFAP